MRHIGSLVLAVLLAPVVLLLVGRGLSWTLVATTSPSGVDELASMFAISAVVLAGGGYALLTLPRFSPLGPVVAGVAYVGFGVWGLLDPVGLIRVLPGRPYVMEDEAVPVTAAVALLLAMPLLLTMLSVRRWAGEPRPAPVVDPYAGYPSTGPTAYPLPGPGPVGAPAAAYPPVTYRSLTVEPLTAYRPPAPTLKLPPVGPEPVTQPIPVTPPVSVTPPVPATGATTTTVSSTADSSTAGAPTAGAASTTSGDVSTANGRGSTTGGDVPADAGGVSTDPTATAGSQEAAAAVTEAPSEKADDAPAPVGGQRPAPQA